MFDEKSMPFIPLYDFLSFLEIKNYQENPYLSTICLFWMLVPRLQLKMNDDNAVRKNIEKFVQNGDLVPG
jgi:hypothetical protein